MQKSLSQRTNCNSWLLLDIIRAATDLNLLLRGKPANNERYREVISLIRETYEDYLKREKVSDGDFASIWECALRDRVVPEIYGISSPMKYDREQFEAGLDLILEQLKDLENPSPNPLRLEFARSLLCRLGQAIRKEQHVWYRQTNCRGYRRDLAA